jgi:4,5-DOPA dioxygenase extradiol
MMTQSPSALFAGLSDRPRMPALFVGHGNPMFAIEDNDYTRAWREVGRALPRPRAILAVSAHWMTRGRTLVHVGETPRTIHDFGGFPEALYACRYPAAGAPAVAGEIIDLVRTHAVEPDRDWGLDHGTWAILTHMFPDADVPVLQVSVDQDLAAAPRHFLDLGTALAPLRDQGVLILASGNLVHNLRAMDWSGGPPHDWAQAFDSDVAAAIAERDLDRLCDPARFGKAARLAHPTWDHYWPMLFALGAAESGDDIRFFNASIDMGSISMRSFLVA